MIQEAHGDKVQTVPDVLRKPSYMRRELTAAKILNYLANGKARGFREIQKSMGISPTTLNSYLKKWKSKGQITRIGKQRKCQITARGLEELKMLMHWIELTKKRSDARLTSTVVHIPLPSISCSEAAKRVSVTVGARAGTWDPLSLETQAQIEAIVQEGGPGEQVVRKIRDKFGFDYVKITKEYIIGSPILSVQEPEPED